MTCNGRDGGGLKTLGTPSCSFSRSCTAAFNTRRSKGTFQTFKDSSFVSLYLFLIFLVPNNRHYLSTDSEHSISITKLIRNWKHQCSFLHGKRPWQPAHRTAGRCSARQVIVCSCKNSAAYFQASSLAVSRYSHKKLPVQIRGLTDEV